MESSQAGWSGAALSGGAANDPPVVTGALTAAVTEAAGKSGSPLIHKRSGSFSFTDDATDRHFVSVSPSGSGAESYLGTLVLGPLSEADGRGSIGWTFEVPDGALDRLAKGQQLVQTYDVVFDDQRGGVVIKTIAVTLTGSNDAPVPDLAIATLSAPPVTEKAGRHGEASLHLRTGTIPFADLDLADVHSVRVGSAASGYLGKMTARIVVDPVTREKRIEWTYSAADKLLDPLAEGETRTQSYLFTLSDGRGGTSKVAVEIELTGANDRPVVTGAKTASIVETSGASGSPEMLTRTGTLAFSDDLSDLHSVSVTPVGSAASYLGTFTLGVLDEASGKGSVGWTFDVPDRDLDWLSAGQKLTQSYKVAVQDQHGAIATHVVTVTLTGSNDAPSVDLTTATISDGTVDPLGGTIEAAPVLEMDGITGHYGAHSRSGSISFADIDTGDSFKVAVQPPATGAVGALTAVLAAGRRVNWSWTAADRKLDYLAVGETLTQSYWLEIGDGRGGVARQRIDFRFEGTNDAPLIAGANQRLSIEAVLGATELYAGGGAFEFSDTDWSDGHIVSVAYNQAASSPGTALGTFAARIDQDSGGGAKGLLSWDYSFDPASADIASFGVRKQVYTVTLTDASGAISTKDVTVTLASNVPLDYSKFQLTFSDDFDSFACSADGSVGWRTTYVNDLWPRTHPREAQFYSDASVGVDPFSLADGFLTITAAPGENPLGLPFNSGLITSEGSFSQLYGYFEMRAKVPAGAGLWPAFWLLPKDDRWPPELDAMEIRGHSPHMLHVGKHWGTRENHFSEGYYHRTVDLSLDFHVYGVSWAPDFIRYYLDGQQVYVTETPPDMNTAMYMLANLAVGGEGSFAGSWNASTPIPSMLVIDYIRAWQFGPPADRSTSSATALPEMDASQPAVEVAHVAPAPLAGLHAEQPEWSYLEQLQASSHDYLA